MSGRYLGGSSELYQLLIPDAMLKERHTSYLIVVPSDILHHLPIEALVDKDGQYVVEKFNVSYVPSTTMLRPRNSRQTNRASDLGVLAIGDPLYPDGSGFALLEHSFEEIAAIVDVFGSEMVTQYTGNQATKSIVTEHDFAGTGCLHISAHGFGDFVSSDKSALMLSIVPEVDGSGLLTSEDICRLNLPLELVYLSACRTGIGRMIPGEGVMSLSRSFLEAGCGTVIASVWNVDDAASADLVRHFYAGLKEGNTVARSLALAKRSLLSSGRALRPHPYFWAPYLSIGCHN